MSATTRVNISLCWRIGKSTLISLLWHLCDSAEGRVTIDGPGIREVAARLANAVQPLARQRGRR